ncbi:MAG: hypothetical protein ACOYB3_12855 [Azonexus sp.]
MWGGPAAAAGPGPAVAQTPFVDPDPFQDLAFPTAVAAKRAIAEYLGTPLAKLPAEALAALDTALAESLRKVDVIDYARTHLKPLRGG